MLNGLRLVLVGLCLYIPCIVSADDNHPTSFRGTQGDVSTFNEDNQEVSFTLDDTSYTTDYTETKDIQLIGTHVCFIVERSWSYGGYDYKFLSIACLPSNFGGIILDAIHNEIHGREQPPLGFFETFSFITYKLIVKDQDTGNTVYDTFLLPLN